VLLVIWHAIPQVGGLLVGWRFQLPTGDIEPVDQYPPVVVMGGPTPTILQISTDDDEPPDGVCAVIQIDGSAATLPMRDNVRTYLVYFNRGPYRAPKKAN
jgi:hypothetical protein